MEPYRIFVDVLVKEIVSEDDAIDELTTALKMQLLKIPVMDVVIENKKSPLMVALSRTTNSLYECLAGRNRKILYPCLN